MSTNSTHRTNDETRIVTYRLDDLAAAEAMFGVGGLDGALKRDRRSVGDPMVVAEAGTINPFLPFSDDVGLRALSYARASVDRYGRRTSVEVQGKLFAHVLPERGIIHLRHFEDNNRSASKGAGRDLFDALLAAAEAETYGPVDLIFIYDISRLFRSLTDKVRVDRLRAEKGLDVIALQQGVDTRTEAGRMMYAIWAEVGMTKAAELQRHIANYHGVRIEKRLPTLAHKRPFGVQFAGKRPTRNGFGPSHTTRDEWEIERALWAYEQILDNGKSYGFVRRAFNDPRHPMHCTTTSGGQWYDRTIISRLGSGSMAGCLDLPKYWEPNDVETVDYQLVEAAQVETEPGSGVWVPSLCKIVSVERVQEFRDHVARVKAAYREKCEDGAVRPREGKWLLSSVSVCALCGTPINNNSDWRAIKTARELREQGKHEEATALLKDKRRYRCPSPRGCGGVSIDLTFSDEFVRLAVKHRVVSGELEELIATATDNEEHRTLMREVQELIAFIDQFENEGVEAGWTPKKIDEKLATKRQRLAQKTARLDALRAVQVTSIDIPADLDTRFDEHWEKHPLSWRKELIRLAFAEVKIGPSGATGAKNRDPNVLAARFTLVPRESIDIPEDTSITFGA